MTQLIGVLCENKKKVIMLSDRMVTTGNGTLAFEHESKSAIISPHARRFLLLGLFMKQN